MTRVRHICPVAVVLLAGWGLVSGCGGQQALDVTAPDDSSSSTGWEDDTPLGDEGQGAGEEEEAEAWDPCLQKKCGAPCTQCSPNDEDCDELQVLKQCNAAGECVIAPADCSAVEEEE